MPVVNQSERWSVAELVFLCGHISRMPPEGRRRIAWWQQERREKSGLPGLPPLFSRRSLELEIAPQLHGSGVEQGVDMWAW